MCKRRKRGSRAVLRKTVAVFTHFAIRTVAVVSLFLNSLLLEKTKNMIKKETRGRGNIWVEIEITVRPTACRGLGCQGAPKLSRNVSAWCAYLHGLIDELGLLIFCPRCAFHFSFSRARAYLFWAWRQKERLIDLSVCKRWPMFCFAKPCSATLKKYDSWFPFHCRFDLYTMETEHSFCVLPPRTS